MKRLSLGCLIVLLLSIFPAVSADVKLIDVSADGTACIFKVNSKIVVVEERDTKVVDGYRIYVQEAYPLHSQAEDSDKCKALVSFSGKGLTTVAEGEAVNKNTSSNDAAINTTKANISSVNTAVNTAVNTTSSVVNQTNATNTTAQKKQTAALNKPIAQAPTYGQRLWSFWKRLFT